MSEEKWLAVEEICKYLSVTKDTIYKVVGTKEMPNYKAGRGWMFQKTDIDVWIKIIKAADTK